MLSDTLQTSGGEFVLGKLTFADLAMAVATSAIEPFGPFGPRYKTCIIVACDHRSS